MYNKNEQLDRVVAYYCSKLNIEISYKYSFVIFLYIIKSIATNAFSLFTKLSTTSKFCNKTHSPTYIKLYNFKNIIHSFSLYVK